MSNVNIKSVRATTALLGNREEREEDWLTDSAKCPSNKSIALGSYKIFLRVFKDHLSF